jgi:hypothetical protein
LAFDWLYFALLVQNVPVVDEAVEAKQLAVEAKQLAFDWLY